jgi:glycosyltransferase involved in cell wall biosynthesis
VIADVRWFAESAHGAIVIPAIEALGLTIAREGDDPARLAMSMGNPMAPQAWRFAARHDCPLVQFVWDLPPWRVEGGRYDWVWSFGGRLVAIPRIGGRFPGRPEFYSKLRHVAAHAAGVWVPSAATGAAVRRHFEIECRKVPYCYDSNRFTPGPRRSGEPTLLSVSRLTVPKNHEAVIRAGHLLGMPVRIIGPGDRAQELRALAATLKVKCTVDDGWVPDDEVVAAYRDAALVIAPSRFEGMGLSGIEAAACGTRVVASDIPPHREFLEGVAQFFTLDDDASLERAARTALTLPPPEPALVAEYRIEVAARRFHAGFQAVLNQRGPAAGE